MSISCGGHTKEGRPVWPMRGRTQTHTLRCAKSSLHGRAVPPWVLPAMAREKAKVRRCTQLPAPFRPAEPELLKE